MPMPQQEFYGDFSKDISALSLPGQVQTAVLLPWHKAWCKLPTLKIQVNSDKTKLHQFLGVTAVWLATANAPSAMLVFRFST